MLAKNRMYLKAQSSGHHRLTRSPPSCGVWDTRKEGRKIKCGVFFSSCKFDANFTFLSFFLSFFFLLRMHWFRKTPWHVVSAGSIRRSQLAFSWSSAYLSRPCHASRCFINISKNRRRPVFFTCHRSLRSSSWKLQAKLDAIYVLTKEE